MIARRDDWQSRLDAYLRAAAAAGFVWGSTDCCMNAANAVRDCCVDADPAAGFRGRYTSAVGAVRVLKRTLGASDRLVERLAARIAGDLGLEEIDPVYAQALDIAFLPVETTPGFDGVLALCEGLSFGVPTPSAGYTRIGFLRGARLPGARAWRV